MKFNYKTAKKFNDEPIKSMVKDILLNELPSKKIDQINKALNINHHLTSTYELEVEVYDCYGEGVENNGFYVCLKGTRCGVNFFYNNLLEIARKPVKAEPKYYYSFRYGEGFWKENF